ncbi:hypothetical protein [Microbacterium pullorum]|uniref:hypothetical protein n=1 Tax=Microbacterium pullorum TaxID=2762236 RepID=UPI001781F869|nr:hypothetical protein [Microbacterium pullorum]
MIGVRYGAEELGRGVQISGGASPAGSSGQRHIRQHMTATRPAIIMAAVPFASTADRERALSVMSAIMTNDVEACQTARMPLLADDEM